MQGRKPKPTAIKMLEGNPGKRALNHAEPKPRVVAPRPPEYLGDAEKAKWKAAVKELYQLGLVTVIDLDALAMYCVVFVRWQKAEKVVREKAEFGMTPSSRSRVQADFMDPDNELEQMLFGQRVRVEMTNKFFYVPTLLWKRYQ